MTRKEEIEQTAIAYAEKAVMSPKDDYVISAIADYDHGCIDGFNAGAQWAERNGITPVEFGLITKETEQ